MKSKIGFICKSIYVMLIPNRFIYLFIYLIYCVKTFAFVFFFNDKEGCRSKPFSSHRTQYLITTSVDITFNDLATEYYV